MHQGTQRGHVRVTVSRHSKASRQGSSRNWEEDIPELKSSQGISSGCRSMTLHLKLNELKSMIK